MKQIQNEVRMESNTVGGRGGEQQRERRLELRQECWEGRWIACWQPGRGALFGGGVVKQSAVSG